MKSMELFKKDTESNFLVGPDFGGRSYILSQLTDAGKIPFVFQISELSQLFFI